MPSLDEYRRKRDESVTPEPFGSGGGGGAPIFVVQRHDARRLHYDLRLERDGALASWAVPKGVPLEPGEQRLAVHVEDHPLEYATFAGEIPPGQYGGGTVEIWDSGTYELVEDKPDGGLTFRLRGERLDGLYALVPAKLGGDAKNWLLISKHDDGSVGKAPARQSYSPMLASLGDGIPPGKKWVYEIKWDGYRIVARLAGGEPELRSRKNQDYGARFPGIVRELPRALRTPDCVVDGEVCALDDRGRPSFSLMQQGAPETPIVYYLFDLLEVDGQPLLDRPLEERRERLAELLDPKNPTIRLSATFDDGAILLDAAKAQELEGVMAKRLGSPYKPGKRSHDWVKVKTHLRQEFLIAGYTRGQGHRTGGFGALVLAVRRAGELVYAGNCGTGFTARDITELKAKLQPLRRADPPFAEVPSMPKVRKGGVVWVEPQLVCEVEFAEWTHDGRLRAPSFQGLREDKEPVEVHREEPLPDVIRRGKRELRLTNLDKPFWPEEGITKGDLLRFYRDLAPVLVPHLKDRPFTMKRYPDGWQGKHFFQKDAPSHMPEWIRRVPYHATSWETGERRLIDYALVNDELALLWMVNMGCIDLNAWYSRIDRPDRPDFVLFDLDPADDAGFAETVQVARLVKQVLDALGLVGFPKTSGSDGIHVLVPIERRHTYAETREFAAIVAGALARTHPGLVTTEWTKAKRRGVLIDSNQNGEGKTIASVYSVRPQAGAPVSTPLRWDEVLDGLEPGAFTMDAVLERVERHGDLFAGVLTERQRLGPALDALR